MDYFIHETRIPSVSNQDSMESLLKKGFFRGSFVIPFWFMRHEAVNLLDPRTWLLEVQADQEFEVQVDLSGELKRWILVY